MVYATLGENREISIQKADIAWQKWLPGVVIGSRCSQCWREHPAMVEERHQTSKSNAHLCTLRQVTELFHFSPNSIIGQCPFSLQLAFDRGLRNAN